MHPTGRPEDRSDFKLLGVRIEWGKIDVSKFTLLKNRPSPGFYDIGLNRDSPYFYIKLETWVLLLLTLTAPATYAIRKIRRHLRTTQRIRSQCCVGCGYSLQGNMSGVCPECGAKAPK
jgi:hypothetical protein